MDQITFHHDTVLSDVHVLMPNARHLMTRLNGVGQPVFESRFRILSDHGLGEAKEGGDTDTRDAPGALGTSHVGTRPDLDEDGDLDVTHRPRNEPDREVISPIILQQSDWGPHLYDDDICSKNVIRVEHTMATPLEDVGKQVWRGAFLLADFILSDPSRFAGATVLDLGAGTGLTSIVMATTAKRVYSTDVGEDLLSMCRRNVTLNTHVTTGEVRVRHLDWLQEDLQTDEDLDFRWTPEEVTDMYENTSVIIAADVCYDEDLTDGLFRTVFRLCSRFERPCSIFFSIEKRMNFSLRHLHVTCEAYSHFRRHLSQLQDERGGVCGFTVQQLRADFPQALRYERVEQLELWRVTSTTIRTRSFSRGPPSDKS